MSMIGNTYRKYAHPQLNSFLDIVRNNRRSSALLVSSDSTGNATDEWVYKFGQWLAITYPTYTVRWRLWDDTTKVYTSPVNLNVGTGIYFIDIWNYAIGGTRPDYMLGANYQKAAIDIINTTTYPDVSDVVDVIFVNHSHNVYDEPYYQLEARYAELVEPLLMTHAEAVVCMIHQNPWLEYDADRSLARKGMLSYAKRRGFIVADANAEFYAINKDPSLYLDNVHPSVSGTALFLKAVVKLFTGVIDNNYIAIPKSTLNETCRSLMSKYGTFTAWTNTAIAPDGFSTSGLTSSKDTIIYEDIAKGYSWKLTTVGGAQALINLSEILLNMVSNKGKWVTLGFRYKALSGQGITPLSPIRIRMSTVGTTTVSLGLVYDTWTWKFVTAFITPAQSASSIIYIDASSTAPAGFVINIDRIVLCNGKDMKDIM